MHLSELTTPALIVDADILDANLATMAAALPGPRLRPHIKAHKTTALARRQAQAGHHAFTCATIREVEGMAAAGLGADLLLDRGLLDLLGGPESHGMVGTRQRRFRGALGASRGPEHPRDAVP